VLMQPDLSPGVFFTTDFICRADPPRGQYSIFLSRVLQPPVCASQPPCPVIRFVLRSRVDTPGLRSRVLQSSCPPRGSHFIPASNLVAFVLILCSMRALGSVFLLPSRFRCLALRELLRVFAAFGLGFLRRHQQFFFLNFSSAVLHPRGRIAQSCFSL
jgi:hypothetical protein